MTSQPTPLSHSGTAAANVTIDCVGGGSLPQHNTTVNNNNNTNTSNYTIICNDAINNNDVISQQMRNNNEQTKVRMKTFKMMSYMDKETTFYASYDPQVGLRTAAVLFGFLMSLILYTLYKTKFKRKRWSDDDKQFIERYSRVLADKWSGRPVNRSNLNARQNSARNTANWVQSQPLDEPLEDLGAKVGINAAMYRVCFESVCTTNEILRGATGGGTTAATGGNLAGRSNIIDTSTVSLPNNNNNMTPQSTHVTINPKDHLSTRKALNSHTIAANTAATAGGGVAVNGNHSKRDHTLLNMSLDTSTEYDSNKHLNDPYLNGYNIDDDDSRRRRRGSINSAIHNNNNSSLVVAGNLQQQRSLNTTPQLVVPKIANDSLLNTLRNNTQTVAAAGVVSSGGQPVTTASAFSVYDNNKQQLQTRGASNLDSSI